MVITVECPSCQTSFPVDTRKVPETGVHARCSRCQGVFLVERPREALPVRPIGATLGPAPTAPAPEGAPAAVGAPEAPAAVIPPEAPAAVPTGGQVPEEPAREAAGEHPVAAGPAAPGAPPLPEPATAKGFTFGRRDPHEKARRLARVLVSDMIMYNPERHSQALATGSLKDDFQDEIQKSWQEYVDQVGSEIAEATSYFNDALNDILAKGRAIFP